MTRPLTPESAARVQRFARDFDGRWLEGRLMELASDIERAAEARALPTVEALERTRRYVEGNLTVWSEGEDLLSVAYADIYRKVLNVIDTGDPLATPAPAPERCAFAAEGAGPCGMAAEDHRPCWHRDPPHRPSNACHSFTPAPAPEADRE